MKLYKEEIAELPVSTIVLSRPFNSTAKMEETSDTIYNVGFMGTFVGAGVMLAGMASGLREKVRTGKVPSISHEITKAGVGLTVTSLGGMALGSAMEDVTKEITTVKEKAAAHKLTSQQPVPRARSQTF